LHPLKFVAEAVTQKDQVALNGLAADFELCCHCPGVQRLSLAQRAGEDHEALDRRAAGQNSAHSAPQCSSSPLPAEVPLAGLLGMLDAAIIEARGQKAKFGHDQGNLHFGWECREAALVEFRRDVERTVSRAAPAGNAKLSECREEITTANGLLYRGAKAIMLPEADSIAIARGYMCAEQLVRALETAGRKAVATEPGRSPNVRVSDSPGETVN